MLPARDPAHTAEVRDLHARSGSAAGHPNVGTAVVLARELAASGRPPDAFVFEEAAGLVRIALRREAGGRTAPSCSAPQARPGAPWRPWMVARALRLAPGDIETAEQPQVVSVGLTFLVVQLAQPRCAAPRRRILPGAALLPLDDARSIYAYTTDTVDTGRGPTDIQARMFTGRMTEDHGSATAVGHSAVRAGARGPRCDCGWGRAWTWAREPRCTRMRRSGRTACGRGAAGNARWS